MILPTLGIVFLAFREYVWQCAPSVPHQILHACANTSSSRIHDPFTGAYDSPTLFHLAAETARFAAVPVAFLCQTLPSS